jgi:hypothetical protein
MQGGRQRREEYRRLVVARGFFVIVGIADELRSVKGAVPRKARPAGSVP